MRETIDGRERNLQKLDSSLLESSLSKQEPLDPRETLVRVVAGRKEGRKERTKDQLRQRRVSKGRVFDSLSLFDQSQLLPLRGVKSTLNTVGLLELLQSEDEELGVVLVRKRTVKERKRKKDDEVRTKSRGDPGSKNKTYGKGIGAGESEEKRGGISSWNQETRKKERTTRLTELPALEPVNDGRVDGDGLLGRDVRSILEVRVLSSGGGTRKASR